MQTTLEAALALLKKIEDALSERLVDRNCYCRWGPLYQEVADFLDSAHAEKIEVTPVMIRAGLAELLLYSPREDSVEFAEEIVEAIFLKMLALRPKDQ